MADFHVRSDTVNVEQIMEQIRARIREKRGVDYTEQQIRELAAVKLEKFLDPRGVRSDLLEQFKRSHADPSRQLPNYVFEDYTLFETHRAPVRWIRRLLNPILKLFLNPNPLIQALHIQSQLNTMQAHAEAEQLARGPARDQLTFEVMHNLVLEATRLGIEVKNLKMRVESLSSRLEFNERRARLLESAVVYKGPEQPAERGFQPSGRSELEGRPVESRAQAEYRPRLESAPESRAPSPAVPGSQVPGGPGGADGPGQRSRRRRRRRGRRGGASAAQMMTAGPPQDSGSAGTQSEARASAELSHDQPLPPTAHEPQPDSDSGSGSSEPDEQ